ncbi:MAG: 2Fe-2S iron-sulfur cluster binding domain-containing protein [Caulobacteraceae bacterium]|nr:2Fe-2S iron-sulfur cluster binding domain-containing protein [Caulobacteraceae bacterium]
MLKFSGNAFRDANGRDLARSVEGRRTLADFLRVEAGQTGVHVGCEHGVCGACTVIVNGQAVRDEHALQCGFCTPGVVMTLAALTVGDASPSAHTLLDALGGHLCRRTGYQGLRRAALRLAQRP